MTTRIFTAKYWFTQALIVSVLCGVMILPFGGLLTTPVAHAAFNAQINYQGKLTTSSNVAVPDGSYNIEFKLYTTPTGGSPIWTETWCRGSGCSGSGTDNRIPVTSGLFSTLLGSTTALSGINFNQPLYLGINIGGSGSTPSWDGEMTPRKLFGAVPAAFVAQTLDGLNSSQFLRSDVANATSSASTFVTLNQSGAGSILNLIGQGSASVFNALSTGNIGIGTTSPYAKLSVAGSIVGQNFIATSTTATSTFAGGFSAASLLNVLQSGKVGIGTTAPISKFHIADLIDIPVVTIQGSADSEGRINFVDDSNNSKLSIEVSGGISAIETNNNNELYLAANSAPISILGTGANITSQGGIDLVLGTTGGGNTIISGGNVGIGTTSPFQKLAVQGNTWIAGTTTTSNLYATSSFRLAGRFYDSTNSAGTSNQILVTSGSGTTWTSTSTLGFAPANATSTNFWYGNGNDIYSSNSRNVGIGTASPSAKLDIRGGGLKVRGNAVGNHSFDIFSTDAIGTTLSDNYGYIRFNTGSGGSSSTVMTLLGNGNVGIGTTSPFQTLSVAGTGYFSATTTVAGTLIVGTTTSSLHAAGAVVKVDLESTISGAEASLHTAALSGRSGISLIRSRGSLASGTAVALNDSLGFLGFKGFDGGSAQLPALVEAFVDGTVSAGVVPTRLSFVTGSNGATRAERLTVKNDGLIGIASTTPWGLLSVNPNGITGPAFVVGSSTATNLIVTNSGNVGIGTTSPGGNLEVALGTNQGAAIAKGFFGGVLGLSNETGGIGFRRASDGNVTGGIFAYNDTGGAQSIGIRTRSDFTLYNNVTPALTMVGSSGNIGIGTTSPSARLSLEGTGAALSLAYAGAVTPVVFTPQANSDLSVSIPSSIYFANYSPSNSFRINNAGAFLVNSTGNSSITGTGNFGIGTSTPSVKLTVYDASASNHIRFGFSDQFQWTLGRNSSTGAFTLADQSSTKLTVLNSSGNVGIGTTTPTGLLTVSTGATAGSSAYFRSDSPTSGAINLTFGGTTNNRTMSIAGSTLDVFVTSSGAANNLLLQTGSGLGANVGIGTTSPGQRLSVSGDVLGNQFIGSYFTATSTTASIFPFASTTAISSSNSAYFATTAGAVGIGTTSPNSKLSVVGTTQTVVQQVSAGSSALDVYIDDSVGLVRLGANSTQGPLSKALAFATNDGASLAERMRITAGGNVGIGTTTPISKLNIEGGSANSTTTLISLGAPRSFLANDNSGVGIYAYATNGSQNSHDFGAIYMNSNYTIGADGGGFFHNFYGGLGSKNQAPAARYLSAQGGGVGTTRVDLYTGGSSRLTINSSGNIGIGTTTPAAELNIASTLPGLFISDTDSATNAKHWFMENNSGTLAFGTSTDTLTKTSTRALSITNSGQVQIGQSGDTSARLVVTGGSGGNPIITLNRPGSIQYSWALGGGGLSFSDDTAGFITANMFGDSSINQLFVGQRGKTVSDTRPSLISGTTFGSTAGTDVVASDLRIQSGLGTGAAISPAIRFYTAVVGSSGTTPQSAAERMVISGTGNVGIASTSPWALLSVNPSGITGPAFAVGSSTDTKFQITKGGDTIIGGSNQIAFGGVTSSDVGIKKATIGGGPGLYVQYGDGSNPGRLQTGSLWVGPIGSSLLRLSDPVQGLQLGSATGMTWTSGTSPDTTGSDTGLYRLSAGTLGLGNAAAGDISGTFVTNKIGIASTTPWGLLSVNPNGITGPAFVVGSSTATNLIVTNGGRVGVGTSSPIGSLHVANNGSASVPSIAIGTDDASIIAGGLSYDDVNNGVNLSIGGVDKWIFSYDGLRGANLASEGGGIAYGVTTATAPSLLPRFIDSNTGIGNAGEDILSLVAGGSSVVRVGTASTTITTGNFGIGTTTPASKFTVASSNNATLMYDISGLTNFSAIKIVGQSPITSTNYNFLGGNAASGDSNLYYNVVSGAGHNWRINNSAVMSLSATGLGIGTTTPTASLALYGAGQATAALNTDGALGGALKLIDSGIAANNGGAVLFGLQNSGIGKSFAAIKGLGNNGSSNSTGDLAFLTRNAVADATLSERMRITTLGNIGIGTTTPDRLLNVNGNATFGTIAASTPTATPLNVSFGSTYGSNTPGNTGNLKWDLFTSGSSGSRYGIGMSLNLMEFQAASNGAHAFFVNGGTEAMRIASNGNVGIGTSSPSIVGTALSNFVIGSAAATNNGMVIDAASSGSIRYGFGSNGVLAGGILRNNSASSLTISNSSVSANDLVINSSGNISIATSTVVTNQLDGLSRLTISGPVVATQHITAANPNNYGAVVGLGWLNDVARIRVGGSGTGASNGFDIQGASNTSWLRILNSGNVGIGTTTPTAMLHIGSAAAGGNVKIANGYLCVDNNDTCSGTNTAGGIYSVTAATTGADLAENYKTNDTTLVAGEIVSLDPTTAGYIRRASGDDEVFGIVSTLPGILLGRKIDNSRPVALTGRVPMKVNNEGGVIMPGDRVALSSVPGVGKKAYGAEASVGMALESFNGSTGEIEVFMDRHAGTFEGSKLTALTVSAINDITSIVDLSQTATSTGSVITVTADGKVGIGTTTPNYKMQVAGDLAATAFVNVSTRTSKKDISYVGDAEKDSILAKIRDMKVARYHYTAESDSDPKRLGLIAEEAPAEVLAADGKGVDIYKFSTFVLAGVQAQDERVTKLEQELAAAKLTLADLTNSIASTTAALPAGSQGLAAAVVTAVTAYFDQVGIKISATLAEFKDVVVAKLTAKSVTVEEGITVKDKTTGTYYCLVVNNGTLTNIPGACGSEAATSTPSVPNAPTNSGTPTNNSVVTGGTANENTSTTTPTTISGNTTASSTPVTSNTPTTTETASSTPSTTVTTSSTPETTSGTGDSQSAPTPTPAVEPTPAPTTSSEPVASGDTGTPATN